MIYTQLSPTYKYDILAEAIYGRELEFWHYDFDRINFEHILIGLPECDYRTNMEKRLVDTEAMMKQSERTMAALWSQVDDKEAYDAAVIRTTKKRAADKLKEKK